MLLFVLSLALAPLQFAAADCALNDPLQCYLQAKVIHVPDQCVDVSGTQLCTSNVIVSQLTLSGLPSSYSPSNAFDLLVGATNAGAQVSGKYKYGKLISGSITGTVLMTVSIDALVSTFMWSSLPLPSSLGFAACTFPSMNVDIKFDNAILNAFSSTLDKQIAQAVEKEVCTTLPLELTAKTSAAFADSLDPMLERLIAHHASPPPVFDPSVYVNWSDSVLGKVHDLLDWLQSSRLLKCLAEATKHSAIQLPVLPNLIDALVDNATNGTGSFTVALNKTFVLKEDGNSSIVVHLKSVTLSGLDTVRQLTLLDPVGPASPVSLSSTFAIDTLGMSTDVVIEIKDAAIVGAQVYTEEMVVNGKVENVVMSTETVVAVQQNKLEELFLDQLLSSPRSCLLSIVDVLNVTSLVLDVDVNQLTVTQVAGSSGPLEKDILALVNNTVALVTTGFGSTITGALAGLAQGPIRTSINAALSALRATPLPCRAHEPNQFAPADDLIRWPESSILASIDKVANEVLGSAGINKVLRCATNGTGSVNFPLPGGKIHLGIENLDSFYDFRVLVPDSSPFLLKNVLGLGVCSGAPGTGESVCRPLGLTLSAAATTITTRSPPKLSTSHFSSGSLQLSNLHVNLDALAQVSRNALNNLQVGMLGTKGCMASTVEALQLSRLNVSATNATLRILPSVKTIDLNRAVDFALHALSSPRALAEINQNMANKLGQSDAVCANGGVAPDSGGQADQSSSAEHSGGLSWEWVTAIVVASSSLGLGIAVYLFRHRRLAVSKQFWKTDHDYAVAPVSDHNSLSNEGALLKTSGKNALVHHPLLSAPLRIIVPVLIVANICIFIYSNVAADAVTVMTTYQIGDQPVSDPPFQVYSFSFGSTVEEMWEAKVYFLAILIVIFTGAWPYIKLVVMLCSWVLPPEKLSNQTRYSMLQFVDAYGKYSLLDFMVMILMLVAFAFNLRLGPEGQQLDVTLYTQPHAGFYSFLASTILSLLLGHVVLAAHRFVCEVENEEEQEQEQEEEQQHAAAKAMGMGMGTGLGAAADNEPKQRVVGRGTSSSEPAESLLQHAFQLSESTALCLGLRASLPKSPPRAAGSPSRQSLAQVAEALSLAATAAADPSSPPREAERQQWSLGGKQPAAAAAASNYSVRVSASGRTAVGVVITCTLVLALYGTWVDSFSFSIEGLTGWLLKDAAVVDYSYDYVGVVMLDDSGSPDDWRMKLMQVFFFLFGVSMPVLLCVLLAVAWAVPLSLQRQERLFVVAEVVNAWAALDVFCLAVLAALFQIRQFAQFMVGDKCDGINSVLATYFDSALDGNDVCFDVETSLLPGCVALFLSALSTTFLVAHPSLQLLHTCIEQRKDLGRRRSDSSASMRWGANLAVESGRGGASVSDDSEATAAALEDLSRPLLFEDVALERPTDCSAAAATSSSPGGSPSSSLSVSSIATRSVDGHDKNQPQQQQPQAASCSHTATSRTLAALWWLGLIDVVEGRGRQRLDRSAVLSRWRSPSRGLPGGGLCDVSVTDQSVA